MLFNEMYQDNMIAEAELNDNGLDEVQVSRNSTKALSVSVFPLVGTNSLQQAMFLAPEHRVAEEEVLRSTLKSLIAVQHHCFVL